MSRQQYTILTCDRCGQTAEIHQDSSYPDEWIILLLRDNKWEGKDLKVDLCALCRIWLKNFLSPKKAA